MNLVPILGRLFVDMDGVLADFDKGYHDLFGHMPWEVDDDTMWGNIRDKYATTFFAGLPLMPDAIDGWLAIRHYNPIILTACPEHDYRNVADQKHAWIRKHFHQDPLVLPVVRGKNKARFLQNPGDILIDDFHKNITPWEEAGGVGITHKDWRTTISQLEEIYYERLRVYKQACLGPRAPA